MKRSAITAVEILKKIWNKDTWKPNSNDLIKLRIGSLKMIIINVKMTQPNKLKINCTSAKRLLSALPRRDANIPVAVVPTSAPSTIKSAYSIGIVPLDTSKIDNPTTNVDEFTIAVNK